MIIYIVILIATAVLATEIAYNSELAYMVKKLIWLDEERSALKAMSRFSFYTKLLGTVSYILLPLIFVNIILVNIYKLLIKMANCPYCLSFHIGWVMVLMVTTVTIPEVFIFGLLGIATTHFYERYVMLNG